MLDYVFQAVKGATADVNWLLMVWVFVGTNLMYYPIHYLLLATNEQYRTLKGGYGRQLYVIKNLIKGVFINILAWWSFDMMADTFDDKWNNGSLHNVALLYVMGDGVALIRYALFRAPALQMKTIYHHIAACGLTIASLFVNYELFTYWRWAPIYCYASMVTGIVNLFLGGRLLMARGSHRVRLIAALALAIYFASILSNWGFQIGWFVWFIWDKLWSRTLVIHDAFAMGMGAMFMFFIVVDDIALIKFLYGAAFPKGIAAVTGRPVPSPKRKKTKHTSYVLNVLRT